MKSSLYFGDNYTTLLYLLKNKKMSGKVKLVYIDPPYGTKQDFTVTSERFSTISKISEGKLAYSDKLTGDCYLQFLGERLSLIRDLMAEDGTIYVHIDTKMGHYVKILMDTIFGQKNFINDITRIKCNPKNFNRKGYGNTKDIILFYSKSKNYIWNNPRQELDIKETKARFNMIDLNGRKYTTTPLHAPGETRNGDTGKEWRGMIPPKGRHWRYNPKVLDELDDLGLIEWSSTGNPRKKIYEDDVIRAGAKIQDVWIYKDPQKPKYPTEKNIDMLKMIVSASSNVGDFVLDAFTGSGTTLIAANDLKRNWIGIDESSEAISVCRNRLENIEYDYEIIKNEENNNEQMGKNNFAISYGRRLFG